VCAVEVVGADLSRRLVHSRRVVLAAGAIENARLLQLSDPEGVGLGAGRIHTGRYLQDHPIIHTAEVMPHDYRVLQDRFIALHKRGRKLFPKLRLAPMAQETYGLLDATAVFEHEHDTRSFAAARRLLAAARQRRWPNDVVRDSLLCLQAPGLVLRDAYRRYVWGLATGVRPSRIRLQLWLEQAPDAGSRVTLAEATDVLGLRLAQVDWRCSQQEMETSRRFTRWIADDLARLGLARVRELAPMAHDEAWQAAVRDAAHHAGTTRMSIGPDRGVVDTNLSVHGVPGLYVVGGSVFPVSGYANPTLTIVALALRLARHLRAAPPV
jgi:choline dehydrogenase-like flavoprotein